MTLTNTCKKIDKHIYVPLTNAPKLKKTPICTISLYRSYYSPGSGCKIYGSKLALLAGSKESRRLQGLMWQKVYITYCEQSPDEWSRRLEKCMFTCSSSFYQYEKKSITTIWLSKRHWRLILLVIRTQGAVQVTLCSHCSHCSHCSQCSHCSHCSHCSPGVSIIFKIRVFYKAWFEGFEFFIVWP